MNAQENNKRFYVYLHRRKTDGQVFYVGKGTGRRAYVASGRSQHWARIAEKHGFEVEFIGSSLTEQEAFELECKTIASIDGLCNATSGGEGISGYAHTEEVKQRLSAAHSGRKQNPLVVSARAEKLKGKKRSIEFGNAVSERNRQRGPVSEETRAKMSESHTGRKQSAEAIEKTASAHRGAKRGAQARANMSEGHNHRKKAVLCVDTGVVHKSLEDAAQWLRKSVTPSATRGSIWHVVTGRHKKAYGMEWRYSEPA